MINDIIIVSLILTALALWIAWATQSIIRLRLKIADLRSEVKPLIYEYDLERRKKAYALKVAGSYKENDANSEQSS